MNKYNQLKRLAVITDRLMGKYPPSLQMLQECLQNEGYEVSKRTLQRDMACLRDKFGVEILHNQTNNTYSLNQTDSLCFDAFLRIIRLFNTSEIVLQSLQDKENTLMYLSFENMLENSIDTRHLEIIFTAIKKCEIISFEHENFEKNKISRHSIKPYLLKEYSNKWYVVGAFTDTNCIAVFGLNRIQSPIIEKGRFKSEERERIAALFDNVIGLVYEKAKPEIVKLSVNKEQAKYFKNTLLHYSQELEIENSDYSIFNYYLVPNLELQRLILGYGSQVKVLEPKWFAEQVAQEIKDMLKKYRE